MLILNEKQYFVRNLLILFMKMKKILTVKFAFAFVLLFSATSATTVKAETQFDDIILSTKCNTFNNLPETQMQRQKLVDEFLSGNTMQTYTISPKKQFRIHYDTTGRNAVDLTDNDKNGIPDYIDSVCAAFDYVYEFHIERLGMHRPKSSANDSLYNVFVLELGNQCRAYYGEAVKINPAFENMNNFRKYYSFIRIDNNYSPTDTTCGGRRAFFTTGIDGMKVTAAHEYHHAVQYFYGDDGRTHSIWEMSATFMEMLIYPKIEDYLQYSRRNCELGNTDL